MPAGIEPPAQHRWTSFFAHDEAPLGEALLEHPHEMASFNRYFVMGQQVGMRLLQRNFQNESWIFCCAKRLKSMFCG
jgi:hypothetical protein